MIRRAAGAAGLVLAAASCGHAIFVPPKAPGTPTDASTPWQAATSSCRSAQAYSAAVRLSGRAGTQRIWPIAVDVAVKADQLYLNATFSGRPVFVLAGSAAQATLWLRRDDQRVVKAPAGDIIEAILGISLPPDRLLAILTGCGTRKLDVTSAMDREGLLAIRTPDATVYLTRDGASWHTRAAEIEGFMVEFRWGAGAVPERLWIRSTPGREPFASINISVDDAAVNDAVPATVFNAPSGAASAAPMTLDELRASGPLRKKG